MSYTNQIDVVYVQRFFKIMYHTSKIEYLYNIYFKIIQYNIEIINFKEAPKCTLWVQIPFYVSRLIVL